MRKGLAATLRVYNKGATNRICGNWFVPVKTWTTVPVDFVEQFGGISDFRFDFSDAAEYLAEVAPDGRKIIDWWSPLSMTDGYGRHAIWLIRGLLALNLDVHVRDVGWVDNNYLPADIRTYRAQAYNQFPAKVGVAMTLGYDPLICGHNSLIKIAVTQFETDRLPEKHVVNVNQCNHAVVTSRFGIDMFKKSGVTIPIDCLTPGVDTDFFTYVDRQQDGYFKVLMLGALTKRKDPLAAIRIFQRASDGHPAWKLTIKTRAAAGIKEVVQASQADRRINVLISDDPPEGVLHYYHTNDCLLWPSRGEGVGLPPLEAMSTGMELVCSNNSGMMDYLDPAHAWLIKTSHMESAVSPGCFSEKYVREYGDVGNWWVPDEEHAVKQLRKCFDAWHSGKGKGKKAAEYVRNNHTLQHQARSLLNVVERYF